MKAARKLPNRIILLKSPKGKEKTEKQQEIVMKKLKNQNLTEFSQHELDDALKFCRNTLQNELKSVKNSHGIFEWEKRDKNRTAICFEDVDEALWPAIETLTDHPAEETRAFLDFIFGDTQNLKTLRILKLLHEKFGKAVTELYTLRLPTINKIKKELLTKEIAQNLNLLNDNKKENSNKYEDSQILTNEAQKHNTPADNKINDNGSKPHSDKQKSNDFFLGEPKKDNDKIVLKANPAKRTETINECIEAARYSIKSVYKKKELVHDIFVWRQLYDDAEDVSVYPIDGEIWSALEMVTNRTIKGTQVYLSTIFENTQNEDTLLRLKFLHEHFGDSIRKLYTRRITAKP